MKAFYLVLLGLVACSGSAPKDLFPADSGSPTLVDAAPDVADSRPAVPCPEAPPLALVVSHHLTEQCTGEVPLGLSGRGTRPVYAWDGAGKLYPVTGVYDGAVYVAVGDRCLAGGDYEGYDLFTLGQPL